MLQFDEEKQEKKLEEIRQKEEEDLAMILSSKYGVEYTDLTGISINTDALRLIPEKEARENNVVVFGILGKKIQVAVLSPSSPQTQIILKSLEEKGYTPTVFMVSNRSLEKAFARYEDLSFSIRTEEGMINISNIEIEKILSKVKNLQDVADLVQKILTSKSYRISRLFEVILASAIAVKASDIHIEPIEESVLLRFRLDGILTDVTNFDLKTYNLILSRIKLVSGLKLNIKDRAQDGRFSIKINNTDVGVRTSTLPEEYGESTVMRVLDPNSIDVSLEELGIEKNLLEILKKEIRKPNGIILNTGPTGSGKTTTLYAFLKKINSPDIKIITIENPIEYHLSGIVQTQIEPKKGHTFAKGLRAALRQDPDVMMVGEIRDEETAKTAINSALTGHLVFSTLHTNNSAGTFPRLIDLGIDPKIISTAINIAMAQRLVRKLCLNCKKEVILDGEYKELINKILETIPNKEDHDIQIEKVWEPVGCPECNGIGYKGRIGVFEAILMDENIEKAIISNPSEREIKKIAEPQGLLNMRQDGIIKVLNGTTSLKELRRVIDIEEE
ncbi:GspE/PulE family protein [Patescibacteria group bacterium]